jgi:hypothetical protein
MDKELIPLHVRAVEAALKMIDEAVNNERSEDALKALTDIEHELAALRRILEGQ